MTVSLTVMNGRLASMGQGRCVMNEKEGWLVNGKTNDEIKRWTVRRKSVLVMDIIQGKMTIKEGSQAFDLPVSEIERWVAEGKRGLENALRVNPLEVKEQYERQIKELQQAYGEAMLELRGKKKQQTQGPNEEP